jgi:hypothetical protein
MKNLNELGGGLVGGLVGGIFIAIFYGVIFTLEYPLARVDTSLVSLFAVAGLFTYIVLRGIVKMFFKT